MVIKNNKLRKKSRSPSNKKIILVKSGKNWISFSCFSQIIEFFEKREREFSNLVEKSRTRSRLAEFPISWQGRQSARQGRPKKIFPAPNLDRYTKYFVFSLIYTKTNFDGYIKYIVFNLIYTKTSGHCRSRLAKINL